MSRIEQLINEIEEYIDSCKYQPLSNTKILVNKEEMEELLVELRLRVPEEIKKYQKIINQQEAILADARSQAESMIADATAQTNELVSDHEVMQRAYAKANEILEEAKAQAQEIVDGAVSDANSIRQGAIQYTDNMLSSLQDIASRSIESTRSRYDALLGDLQSVYETCTRNRNELASGVMQQAVNVQDRENYEQENN
ncbi:MAG: vacuolar family H+-ATPase subunit H [Candidatus Avilachnospira sp.]|jgi:F0F1-type ATP synthase membrane subunit b/b'